MGGLGGIWYTCGTHLPPAALEGNSCFGADVIQVFLGTFGQLLAQDLPNKGLVKSVVPCGGIGHY